MIFAKLGKLGWREQAGLLIAVVCILGILLNAFVVRPTMRSLGELQTRVLAAKDVVETDLRILARESEIVPAHALVGDMVHVAESESAAINRMKSSVDELRRQYGLVFKSIDHRPPAEGAFVDEYFVDVGQFEATMDSLLRFLDGLNKAEGLFRVGMLRLRPGEKGRLVKGSMLITKAMLAAEGPEQTTP
jgi:hypothetical protein